jgi:hypothetical protein
MFPSIRHVDGVGPDEGHELGTGHSHCRIVVQLKKFSFLVRHNGLYKLDRLFGHEPIPDVEYRWVF